MDDLEDLQARVAAAQEKLRLNADAQRKYGLRLNDVVTIVEGSLARQQDEMKRLQDAAVALRLERDSSRVAESQTKSLYEAALARLNQLQTQNEQLRNMVMTLLNVIEGRESASALQPVLQRLESSVHEITAAPAVLPEVPSSEATDLTDSAAEPIQVAAEAIEAEESSSVEADAPEMEEAMAEEAIPVSDDVAAAEAEPTSAEPAKMVAADETASVAEDAPRDTSTTEDAVGDAEFEELSEMGDDEHEAGEDRAITQSVVDPSALTMHDAEIEPASDEVPGTEMLDAVAEDIEADDSSDAAEDMPEDIAEMSMNGHRDIVTDADEMLANEAISAAAPKTAAEEPEMLAPAETPMAALGGGNGPQDETLVTALLDAEKALIEAGASGVANANSPVAEIIRRISLRTREFSEASNV